MKHEQFDRVHFNSITWLYLSNFLLSQSLSSQGLFSHSLFLPSNNNDPQDHLFVQSYSLEPAPASRRSRMTPLFGSIFSACHSFSHISFPRQPRSGPAPALPSQELDPAFSKVGQCLGLDTSLLPESLDQIYRELSLGQYYRFLYCLMGNLMGLGI